MPTTSALEDHLTSEETALFRGLDSPSKIQAFLDETPYSPENRNRCPLSVLRDRLAHCLDGALFGAAALERVGHPPRLVDMFPDPGMDDDHVLAIFEFKGRLGSVTKSNFTGLRFREPVYRGLHELVMSYFEDFFNVNGVKTLRYYTRPLKLAPLKKFRWEWSDAGADIVEERLLKLPRLPLFSPETAAELSVVDPASYKAGMMITNPDGLYQPRH